MNSETTTIQSEKPRVGRRWLATAACVAAMVGTGVVLAASPASAAPASPNNIVGHCVQYHSWNECLSYNYSAGDYVLSAYNGYSVSEYETIWFTVNGHEYYSNVTIPSGYTASFAVYTAAGYSCEGIDSVQFGCWQF
jgi:hypothetical protein